MQPSLRRGAFAIFSERVQNELRESDARENDRNQGDCASNGNRAERGKFFAAGISGKARPRRRADDGAADCFGRPLDLNSQDARVGMSPSAECCA